MDFDLTQEQSLLKESVDRLIADRYGDFERRNGYAKEPGGWSRSVWKDYVDLGLTLLPFEESMGGIGGGPLETMIVMEAVGRGLTLEPFFSTLVLGAAALRLGGTPLQQDAIIPRIAAGEAILTLAQGERQARYDLFDVATTACEAEGGGFVLDGQKGMVVQGDSADMLVVSARTAGERRDKTGVSLFLVDARAPGVAIHGYDGQDGQRVAEISFNGARVGADAMLGERDQGLGLLEHVVDIGIAALCAEAVGAMDALYALTLDYLKTRKQFGVPIGSFQVLQHRAVDMMIALEQARSMAVFAAMMADAEPKERRAAISAAKVQINRSARYVGQQAIQLHGGIGMTMEYKAGHYFKRLTMIETLFGDTDHHLAKVAEAGGLLDDAA
jgi:pimeloyl-CoA dehydrogenase small subunit